MQIDPTAHETANLVSIEAEQQLLGAVLGDSSRIDRMGPLATAKLFADPFHARLFGRILDGHKRGESVSPVTLRLWCEQQPGVEDLGGARYLVRLVACSISSDQVVHYARILDGLRAKREIADVARTALVDLSDDETTADVVSGRMQAALSCGYGEGERGPVSMIAATTKALQRVKDAQDGKPVSGITPGIPALSHIVPLFRPGQMVLLGGRPSMGKSAVAIEIATQAATCGRRVCFASLEMPADDMVMRVASQMTGQLGHGVSFSDFESGQLDDRQYRAVVEASKRVAELPIDFLPEHYRDIGALYAGARQSAARMGGLDLFVVDYLQLLRSSARGRFEQITEISIALKSLAMQLGVPVLALTQLSRAVEQREDKRPMLSDLRESGQLEQDADAVIFCFREEYYLEREKPTLDGSAETSDALAKWTDAMEAQRNRLELIVAKQRQGRIGTARCRYNAAMNVFWEA